ncbi:outer membrane lipoprotein carrier protein LolA [Agromyces sp. MMS24-JH15]|uniref:LolA family protein n=1 Tax=Agromyces sp. MMS24-JH15 TaxID=3243765 RepID=UPI003749E622
MSTAPRRSASRREILTWVAAVGVPLAIGAGVFLPLTASAAVDLPDKSVEELIAFAQASDVDALSGTIEQDSELGLPDLDGLVPGSGGDAGEGSGETGDGAGEPADLDDLLALATGSHTAKVYLDGEQARLQVLDRLAERNVYVDGEAHEAWFVDSETKTATRFTRPDEIDLEEFEHGSTPSATDAPTPEEVLDRALADLDETTEVTVGTDGRVAGRDVYELVLAPRTDDTLVGEVRVAIDGEHGVPLAASITARGADEPAFSVAFTDISFTAPDASVFAFEPGADYTVVERELPVPSEHGDDQAGATSEEATGPVVHGDGWSAVVEFPAPAEGGASGGPQAGDLPEGAGDEASAVLERATTPVDGGRVLETALVSVLFTDDGRVLVGAVPAERLVEAAQAGR